MASKNISKAFYKKISKVYDMLDRMYFSAGGRNPREVIGQMIPEDNGKLLILDWDIQESIKGKIKFSPLYVCETLVTPKYFKEYYYSDKRIFFNDYGFELEQMERCDVTFVASFRKASGESQTKESTETVVNQSEKYLKETQMVNYRTDSIQRLVEKRGWKNLDEFERIGAIYDFVRNEIAFGYNRSDTLNAEEVLWDGYGQCNTKSTVLMALLRAVGIPCRLHGSEVSKGFQRGATSGIVSKLAPERVVHTWVEVLYKERWIALEGVITDEAYVRGVKKKFPNHRGIFKGYAISVPSLDTLDLEWKGEDLFVQNTSVVEDYGVFENPEDFFKEHKQRMNKLKELAYIYYGRKVMNKNVANVRRCSGVRPHSRSVCPQLH